MALALRLSGSYMHSASQLWGSRSYPQSKDRAALTWQLSVPAAIFVPGTGAITTVGSHRVGVTAASTRTGTGTTSCK